MTKTILITGCTSGIGRALIAPLTGLGHTIIGCGRNEHAVRDLRGEFAPPHRFDVVDIADWPSVERWAKDVLDSPGAPDLLVNNAGIINRNAPLWEVDADEFASVLAVNVGGPANLIRAFLPPMIERGSGVVANMSSGWGRSTAPEVAPYCASKWAIEGLTQALAQEIPRGLAAVAVNPGVIDTEMLRSCWGDGAASSPTPDRWAERAVPFLLSLGPEHNGRAMSV